MGRNITGHFLFAQEVARIVKTITKINIFEDSRRREIVELRSLVVYILREVENMTYYNIRDFFNENGKNFDHSTALHSYKSYAMYSKYNNKLNEYFNLIIGNSKSINSRKLLAKGLIEASEPEVAEVFYI